MDSGESVNSVIRALNVLEALNRQRVTSLETLHQATALPKATLVRLLETLICAGYVLRVSRREGYALAHGVLRLSAGLRHRDLVVDVAQPLLDAFTRAQKWQVSLATSETDCMLVRLTTRHISPFSREENFLNRRVSMLMSAVGRAYLAACAAEEREVILRSLAAAGEPEAIGEGLARTQAVLERTRRNGYATIGRPRDNPTRSFAVPIMEADAPESPLGAIAMFYYRTAMTEPQATQRYLEPMRELADQIALALARAWNEPEVAPPAP
jgi:IclR family mhp operon transcriptional activator